MKYLFKFHVPYRWFYSFKCFFSNIDYFFRWVMWCYQRAFRGYGDCDVWSIDDYLTIILPPMLETLKKDGMTYPGQGEAGTPEKWADIVDKMIAGFEAHKRIMDLEYEEGKEKPIEQIRKELSRDDEIFKEGMRLFTEYFGALWS